VGAAIVDGLILAVPTSVINALTGGQFVRTDPVTNKLELNFSGGSVTSSLLILAVTLAYFAYLEGGERGQTIGKRLLGIQVRDATTGGTIGPGRALLRRLVANFIWYALIIPGLIDVLMPLWDSRHQSIHDKAAGSVVVMAGPG
jgi:serine/threonine-protein kinase